MWSFCYLTYSMSIWPSLLQGAKRSILLSEADYVRKNPRLGNYHYIDLGVKYEYLDGLYLGKCIILYDKYDSSSHILIAMYLAKGYSIDLVEFSEGGVKRTGLTPKMFESVSSTYGQTLTPDFHHSLGNRMWSLRAPSYKLMENRKISLWNQGNCVFHQSGDTITVKEDDD